MKMIILFSAVLFFCSCDKTNTKIKEVITGSDSIAINYFKGDGSMDTVTKVRIIRDKVVIEQLADYIAAVAATSDIKCGYDGSLHFFKKNMVIKDIDFRMNDVNCMQFSFLQEGKLTATTLSPEAKQFLESIKEKETP